MKNQRLYSRFLLWMSSSIWLTGLLIQPVAAQTFLDRLDPNAFRIVSYNVYFDDLFDHPATAPDELARMIAAIDADVYNFQELFNTSASEVEDTFNSLAPLGGNASWQAHKGRNQVIVSRFDLSQLQTDVPGGTRGIAMAMVDLPDAHFSNDFYILNNHFPCCDNDQQRITESMAIAAWLKDATTPGGNFDFDPGTAISVLGDLNIVGGPLPLDILLHGESGPGPDWDGTSITAAQIFHNVTGNDNWTWRNDESQFDPGILDYILYTDSVISMQHGYILNPSQMTSGELAASGLQATDFMLNKNQPQLNVFDHLPLVVDFVSLEPVTVVADSFNLTFGQYISGSIFELSESDNIDLIVTRSTDDIQSRIYIELKGVSPSNTPSQLEFTLEASVFARTEVVQSIDLFNYDTNEFEEVDIRTANRFTDLVTTIEPAGDISRFIETVTGCVEARLRFESTTPRQQFSANIDQVLWTILQ